MIQVDWTERYSRQILLPEVGGQGQRRLLNAGVGVFGATPMAVALLDTLARSGIGRLGMAGFDGMPDQQKWHDHVKTLVRASNQHTQFDISLSQEVVSESLAQWAASWDVVVDASGSTTVRSHLGHSCLAGGKKFLSCWMSQGYGGYGGYGRILSLKPSPDQPSPCPDAQYGVGTEPQCLDPSLDLLIPGLIGATLAGEILSGLLGFGCKDEFFLLHIDAKRVHYDRIRLGGDSSCAKCRGGLYAAAHQSASPPVRQSAGPMGKGESPGHPGETLIDITGERCPMTFVRVKLRMESLPQGALLRVRLAGDSTLENVSLSLANQGHAVLNVTECAGVFTLLVRKQK